jgi:hypothetical protein
MGWYTLLRVLLVCTVLGERGRGRERDLDLGRYHNSAGIYYLAIPLLVCLGEFLILVQVNTYICCMLSFTRTRYSRHHVFIFVRMHHRHFKESGLDILT